MRAFLSLLCIVVVDAYKPLNNYPFVKVISVFLLLLGGVYIGANFSKLFESNVKQEEQRQIPITKNESNEVKENVIDSSKFKEEKYYFLQKEHQITIAINTNDLELVKHLNEIGYPYAENALLLATQQG